MIAEEMDKSLAVLQNLTCWPIESLTYLSLNQRKESSKNKFAAETIETLRHWLKPDYMLYEHFKRKFDQILASNANWIADSVAKLKIENDKVQAECVISHTDNHNGLKGDFRMWSSNSLGYKINEKNHWCKYYAISEMAFTKELRKLQKQRKIWD